MAFWEWIGSIPWYIRLSISLAFIAVSTCLFFFAHTFCSLHRRLSGGICPGPSDGTVGRLIRLPLQPFKKQLHFHHQPPL